MKLLLDENLPKRLKQDYAEHEIYTKREKGRNGIKNGQLLQLLTEHKFDALLTFNKNLQHQQNFNKYTLTVFVLSAQINSYSVLSNLTPETKEYLNSAHLPNGPAVIKQE